MLFTTNVVKRGSSISCQSMAGGQGGEGRGEANSQGIVNRYFDDDVDIVAKADPFKINDFYLQSLESSLIDSSID